MATAEGYDNLGPDQSDCDQPASSTSADAQNIVVRVCALNYSNVIEYTIPSFSVIKVNLRQAVIQTVDTSGEPIVLDVFFREDSSLNTKLPQELTIDEACIVDVSGLHVLVDRMSSCIIYHDFLL